MAHCDIIGRHLAQPQNHLVIDYLAWDAEPSLVLQLTGNTLGPALQALAWPGLYLFLQKEHGLPPSPA